MITQEIEKEISVVEGNLPQKGEVVLLAVDDVKEGIRFKGKALVVTDPGQLPDALVYERLKHIAETVDQPTGKKAPDRVLFHWPEVPIITTQKEVDLQLDVNKHTKAMFDEAVRLANIKLKIELIKKDAGIKSKGMLPKLLFTEQRLKVMFALKRQAAEMARARITAVKVPYIVASTLYAEVSDSMIPGAHSKPMTQTDFDVRLEELLKEYTYAPAPRTKDFKKILKSPANPKHRFTVSHFGTDGLLNQVSMQQVYADYVHKGISIPVRALEVLGLAVALSACSAPVSSPVEVTPQPPPATEAASSTPEVSNNVDWTSITVIDTEGRKFNMTSTKNVVSDSMTGYALDAAGNLVVSESGKSKISPNTFEFVQVDAIAPDGQSGVPVFVLREILPGGAVNEELLIVVTDDPTVCRLLRSDLSDSGYALSFKNNQIILKLTDDTSGGVASGFLLLDSPKGNGTAATPVPTKSPDGIYLKLASMWKISTATPVGGAEIASPTPESTGPVSKLGIPLITDDTLMDVNLETDFTKMTETEFNQKIALLQSNPDGIPFSSTSKSVTIMERTGNAEGKRMAIVGTKGVNVFPQFFAVVNGEYRMVVMVGVQENGANVLRPFTFKLATETDYEKELLKKNMMKFGSVNHEIFLEFHIDLSDGKNAVESDLIKGIINTLTGLDALKFLGIDQL